MKKTFTLQLVSPYRALATAIVMAEFPAVRGFLEPLAKKSYPSLVQNSFSNLHLSHLHLFAYCEAASVPVDIFRLAVDAGFKPGGLDAEGNTLLHLLIRRGRLNDLEVLLTDPKLRDAFKPHLNVVNHEGQTVLHIAVLGGHTSAVKALLEAGADAKLARRSSRLSPLHMAVLGTTSKDVAQLLLSHGAEVNATSLMNKTPLDMACEKVSTCNC